MSSRPGEGSPWAASILWSDETAVVVAKPSGLLVHNSAWAGPREETLQDRLVQGGGGPYHPVHRLDRGASGVVVFARSPEATSAWQGALAAPETVKGYLALVRGHLSEARRVDHPIRDRRAGCSEVTARPAVSEVRPVAVSPVERCSLVEVRIQTGRRHQVRRHLKHLSHPVVGDTTWGRGEVNRRFREAYGLCRLALHGAFISLRHPLTCEALRLECPLPADLEIPLALLFPEGW